MAIHRFTPEAKRDLEEIDAYLSADDPAAAARVLVAIRERCRALADRPEMGRSREEFAPGLRSSVVHRFVLFFRAVEEGIEVVRIIHGARDIPRQFD